jgi:hypothetical protein
VNRRLHVAKVAPSVLQSVADVVKEWTADCKNELTPEERAQFRAELTTAANALFALVEGEASGEHAS